MFEIFIDQVAKYGWWVSIGMLVGILELQTNDPLTWGCIIFMVIMFLLNRAYNIRQVIASVYGPVILNQREELND